MVWHECPSPVAEPKVCFCMLIGVYVNTIHAPYFYWRHNVHTTDLYILIITVSDGRSINSKRTNCSTKSYSMIILFCYIYHNSLIHVVWINVFQFMMHSHNKLNCVLLYTSQFYTTSKQESDIVVQDD